MDIGIIGLGKMGYALALNMRDQGYKVVATNRSPEKVDEIAKEGVVGVKSIEELVAAFGEKRKVIWLMVPAGQPVDDMIETLLPMLRERDIVIDGGNSNFNDTVRRHAYLKDKGIAFLDVGTSGGTEGARHGACLMMGGDTEPAEYVAPMLKALAVEGGFGYFGAPGSGHYVKMIHNGIEYGMMQAIGEGFDILKASEFDLDFELVSKVWSNGSIIEGLLMRLMHEAFKSDPNLDEIVGKVDASGEADWTVQESIRLKVSAPVISQSLFTRYKSKDDVRFSEKSVAALRNQFGGHKVYKA
ncbi:phosphogluconate dehydrogenase (NAD(+)-dependent, decarboxylating) [Fusibacter tunisiensis]|jgi:6-phosphogluconate dehydrogenase|uniref:6-phosphogluconate dehydrogenase n=1 Tax=Fusibacter tunisiensis TaxID=1008308 RepID=A0ABS2MT56_9FIRM|nr:decarboxylating 6-phosphogluconate dehydrogenase [Fusibacter tunisiensis]MBM7562557.1 6-phosphogluconate dehydrogenase [Fusibacter tunisiensis]